MKKGRIGVSIRPFFFWQCECGGDSVMVYGNPVRTMPEWLRIQPFFEKIQPIPALIRPFLIKIRPE
ncbi:hypothetical protein FHE72_20000 [Rossellomorea vietnamensis]|uniref:Uncharacterized protein n=1 Tax=Rossellomorea vietnamensis TaxID=218284 RepID=A0A6I6UUV0_9BACI|nr:hypothetical protein [Rossellomorea vietnamensis]QHE63033.1 hypothetical protein FHE72_20000 [Rossellomorea vietnamensis]